MGRTSVSLSLDSETLRIWNQIPKKKRSAQVREHLRSLLEEGALPLFCSGFESRKFVKDEFQKTSDSIIASLTELPKKPAKKPVEEKESSMVYDFTDTIDFDK